MWEEHANENKEEVFSELSAVVAATTEDAATTLNTLESESKVFLQTAKAIVMNDRERKILTRCVMDNGSQRTYISEKLAYLLDLQVMGLKN